MSVVRNEAGRLPALLESLAPFRSLGGEVVVLDTGSEDETLEIAREAGCVVARKPRQFARALTAAQVTAIHKAFAKGGEGPLVRAGDRVFNIASARNAADAMARNDFILGVDASDRFEAFDLPSIEGRIREGEAAILPFETRRLHRGRWVLELRDYFHDRRSTAWFGRAHNYVAGRKAGSQPVKAPLSRDCLRVTHHTESAKDRGYQLTGLALDVLEHPSAVHRQLVLGAELSARGFRRSALALFEGLDRPHVHAAVRSSALSMAANCLPASGAGSGEAATGLLFKAIRRDPSHRHPFLNLARILLGRGDFQGAATLATAALAIPPRVTFSQLEENLRDGPHAILYWALLWLGRKPEAAEHFRICRKAQPESPIYAEHARFFGDGSAS